MYQGSADGVKVFEWKLSDCALELVLVLGLALGIARCDTSDRFVFAERAWRTQRLWR